jgi:plasmid replication initiation protein
MENPNLDKIDQIMLMQPNNVTFGQYSVNAIQENILTLIVDALQQHERKTKLIQTDLWGQPTITMVCDEAAGMNNKNAVKFALHDLTKKTFSFKWVHPNMGKIVETTGVIVTTWHDLKGSNRIELTLNVWAIPFLVYYGVGVGGTRFDKAIALTLSGEYTKRIYKMIRRWYDKPSFKYDIEKFRKELSIPNSYDNNKIENIILKTSAEKIKESGSETWFEYELTCERPIKRRKPKADTIIFKIRNRKPIETKGENHNQYMFVYRWLSDCWDTMKSSKAREIADELNNIGELEKVYKRCCYWDDLITSGKRDKAGQAMTKAKAVNSLKKMLREDFKLE